MTLLGIDKGQVFFTIPQDTPAGDYLFRVEHIGLHVASAEGAAQFYLACGQITVTGSGGGNPSPLVSFPGAYSPTDPGIMINIYYPYVSLCPKQRHYMESKLTHIHAGNELCQPRSSSVVRLRWVRYGVEV
jgi:hypothetical protein